ncbi:MAG: YcxB family protein [Anaerolineales bacterium]|nr:YcxB family protein [Anaerolineales bacterium]
MPEPMTIRFTPTAQDYVGITRALYARQPGNWVFLSLLVVLSAFSIYLEEISASQNLFILLLPPVSLLFFIVMGFGVRPWQAGNRAKKNERMTAEVTWEANDEFIILKTVHSESKTDWGNYKKAFENDEFLFFNLSTVKNYYQFLPKRAFESPAQLEAFRTLVKSKLPGLK